MSYKFFQTKAFLSYWLDAVDEHSLHSPFFFDFYANVVKRNTNPDGFEQFEKLRRKLLNDSRTLSIHDPGSGNKTSRAVSEIANSSLSPAKFSQLYARIINHIKAQQVIELGTSFGINALYLADKKDVKLATFEGSPQISEIASLTFEFAQAKNINLINGNIDATLPVYLQSIRRLDFAFVDANHRYQPTLKYFGLLLPKLRENSVLILDDIHYSPEMERAWNEIKKHKLVYASADLFRCGILFFDPSLNKQHVILQF